MPACTKLDPLNRRIELGRAKPFESRRAPCVSNERHYSAHIKAELPICRPSALMLIESVKLADRQLPAVRCGLRQKDFQYLRVVTQIARHSTSVRNGDGWRCPPAKPTCRPRNGRRLAVPRHEGKNQTAQGRRRIGARLKGQCAHRLTRTAGQERSDASAEPDHCVSDGCGRKVTPTFTLAGISLFHAP